MKCLRQIIERHNTRAFFLIPTRNVSSGLHEWHQNKIELGLQYQNVSSKDVYNYDKLFPWKTVPEFSDFIISSIVYRKDNLVALNKPYGVKVYNARKQELKAKSGTPYLKIAQFPFVIEDAIPALKDHLNISDLHILKSAEMYTSGIIIMGTDEKASRDVLKSVTIAKQDHTPHLTHQFLTSGNPDVLHQKERVGIKFIEVGDSKELQYEISSKISNRACKQRLMQSVRVDYKVLNNNKELHSSLVEIATNSMKWHFLRVYASSRIASILGDFMYGARRTVVLGMPVQLNTQTLYAPQTLPEPIQRTLNLRPGTADFVGIPTMLHFKSMFLPLFHGENVTITAEPPPHFKWTCAKLNLLS